MNWIVVAISLSVLLATQVCDCKFNDSTIGFPVTPNQFPWYVLIEPIKPSGEVEYSCGGTIISTTWILASAGCGYFKTEYFVLKFGSVNFSKSTIVYNATTFIPHPEFDWYWSQTNIALIRLDEPLKFSPYLSSIKLPESVERFESYIVDTNYFIGIVDDERVDRKQLLRWGYTQLITNEECANITTNYPTSEMCSVDAGIAEGKKILCYAIPGSPLAVYRNKEWIQIGITSIAGCNRYPSVFTNIALFVDWIRTTQEEYDREHPLLIIENHPPLVPLLPPPYEVPTEAPLVEENPPLIASSAQPPPVDLSTETAESDETVLS